MQKVINILKMTGWILLYFVLYFIVSGVIGAVLGAVLGFKIMAENQNKIAFDTLQQAIQNDMVQYTNIIIAGTSIGAFLLIWLVLKLRKQKLFSICQFTRISLKETGILALGGLGLNLFISSAMSWIVELASLQDLMSQHEEITNSVMSGNIIVVILIAGFIAPFFEEIFFRGVIFSELNRNMPLAAAVIIQALIFGVFHGNWLQGVYALILGIIFSMISIWFKSLLAPIIVHIAFNSLSAIMDKTSIGKTLEPFGGLLLLVGLLLSAILAFIIWKNRNKEPKISEGAEVTV